MDPVRLGSDVRLLRRSRGWSQARLGAEAGVSRWVVSEIERGRSERLTLGVVRRVVEGLGAVLSGRVRYQGETLDRLRDQAHAAIVEAFVVLLVALGWVVETEVSFNHFGERGSIDILAFHPRLGALLVIEVKSVVPEIGGMLMTLDRKVRIAPELATVRGWNVRSVSRLLVLPETSTARRRVGMHAATFQAALPDRNEAVRRWLRRPDRAIRGLFFLSDAAGSRRKGPSGA